MSSSVPQRSHRGRVLRMTLLGVVLLGGCSGSRDAAQRLIENVDVAVLAAGPDAMKYAPEEVRDIEHELGTLQAAYDRGDYRTVLDSGQALLARSRELAARAARQKADTRHALEQRWGELSRRVPAALAAVERGLAQAETGRANSAARTARAARSGTFAGAGAAAPDLTTARASLHGAERLWSKAQGAFGNANLEEAVSAGGDAEARLQALALQLGVVLEPTVPTQDLNGR